MPQVTANVIEVIRRIGKLDELRPDQDIYESGFSSLKALELLFELESTFGVSIPDDDFMKARTPTAFRDLVSGLRSQTSGAL